MFPGKLKYYTQWIALKTNLIVNCIVFRYNIARMHIHSKYVLLQMPVRNDNPVKHACLFAREWFYFFKNDHPFIFAADTRTHLSLPRWIAIYFFSVYLGLYIRSPKLIRTLRLYNLKT